MWGHKAPLCPSLPDAPTVRARSRFGGCQVGSLGAAGRELGLTQQAVLARLTSIEAQTGVRLAVRTARGSQLTPPGLSSRSGRTGCWMSPSMSTPERTKKRPDPTTWCQSITFFVTTGTAGLCDPTTSRPLPKAMPDGDDEGMTHTAPSPSIAHPNPARWLWYTFRGRLGPRYSGWCCATPPLAHAGCARLCAAGCHAGKGEGL